MKPEKPNQGQQNRITLVFIVNGTPTEVTTNIKAPLKSAAERALEQTGNTGRPISAWQVIYEGNVLDMDKKIEEFDFQDGAELSLSLKAGAGGA